MGSLTLPAVGISVWVDRVTNLTDFGGSGAAAAKWPGLRLARTTAMWVLWHRELQVFNSGSYNTGIGNSGIATREICSALEWVQLLGVVNAGSWRTGSFSAGQATRGFNEAQCNTGWLNTGDINGGQLRRDAFTTGSGFATLAGRLPGPARTLHQHPSFPGTVANIHASGGAGPSSINFRFPPGPQQPYRAASPSAIVRRISPDSTVRIGPVFVLRPHHRPGGHHDSALGTRPGICVTVGPMSARGSIIDPFNRNTLLGFINVMSRHPNGAQRDSAIHRAAEIRLA